MPSSNTRKRRSSSRKRGRQQCRFCGSTSSETRLLEKAHSLICEACFDQIGQIFARRETPLLVQSESCISCGRSARARLLVAGVAAAICRECYVSIRRKDSTGQFERPPIQPTRPQLRALQRSRAARLRDREDHDKLGQAYRSIQPSDRATRGPVLLAKQVLAEMRMESHLELVTSRRTVQGRPALTLPNGQLPMRRED